MSSAVRKTCERAEPSNLGLLHSWITKRYRGTHTRDYRFRDRTRRQICNVPYPQTFPGSEIYYQLDERGLIDSRDIGAYGVYMPPIHHLEEVSPERILSLQRLAFRRFYYRPTKILEHLKGIRSFTKFAFLPCKNSKGGSWGLVLIRAVNLDLVRANQAIGVGGRR